MSTYYIKLIAAINRVWLKCAIMKKRIDVDDNISDDFDNFSETDQLLSTFNGSTSDLSSIHKRKKRNFFFKRAKSDLDLYREKVTGIIKYPVVKSTTKKHKQGKNDLVYELGKYLNRIRLSIEGGMFVKEHRDKMNEVLDEVDSWIGHNPGGKVRIVQQMRTELDKIVFDNKIRVISEDLGFQDSISPPFNPNKFIEYNR